MPLLNRSEIGIILSGEPQSQARPRVYGKGAIDPCKTKKNAVKWQVLDQTREIKDQLPFHCPIEISLHFFFPIPKDSGYLHEWSILPCMYNKDIDNLAKLYLDALNGIIYKDDRQIVALYAFKHYDQIPRTLIKIMPQKTDLEDKAKEILAMISVDEFFKIGESFANLLDLYHCDLVEERGKQEIAYEILKFAESHAEILTKIKKKFTGSSFPKKKEKEK